MSEEPGQDVLVKAISNRGDVGIRTGEFRYSLRVTEDVPTDKMIAEQVEIHRATLREAMKRFVDKPNALKKFQTGINTADQYDPHPVADLLSHNNTETGDLRGHGLVEERIDQQCLSLSGTASTHRDCQH